MQQPTIHQIGRAMLASQQQLTGIADHDWSDKTAEPGKPRMPPPVRHSMETMRSLHRDCLEACSFHLMGFVAANDPGMLVAR